MPYIGVFSEENIQKAITYAAAKLGEGKSGLIAHIDSDGNATVSLVQRIGGNVSIEATGVMDFSTGFKFDKNHLKAQAELIAKW